MSVKKIVKIGDPVLRQRSMEVEKIDSEIISLVQDMKDTISVDDYNAVGLAAPQIGVLKRVIMINWGKIQVYINPEIEILDSSTEELHEGCLSVYSVGAMIKRPKKIRVKAMNLKGEKLDFIVEGMLARIFIHEKDHLEGKLFIDYLDSKDKRDLMIKISEMSRKN